MGGPRRVRTADRAIIPLDTTPTIADNGGGRQEGSDGPAPTNGEPDPMCTPDVPRCSNGILHGCPDVDRLAAIRRTGCEDWIVRRTVDADGRCWLTPISPDGTPGLPLGCSPETGAIDVRQLHLEPMATAPLDWPRTLPHPMAQRKVPPRPREPVGAPCSPVAATPAPTTPDTPEIRTSGLPTGSQPPSVFVQSPGYHWFIAEGQEVRYRGVRGTVLRLNTIRRGGLVVRDVLVAFDGGLVEQYFFTDENYPFD